MHGSTLAVRQLACIAFYVKTSNTQMSHWFYAIGLLSKLAKEPNKI